MKNFLEKFGEIVQKYPGNIAILTDGQEKVDYKSLYGRAAAICQMLKRKRVSRGDIVALNMDKSADYVASIIGVWMANAAFIPIPKELPKERRRFIIRDARPKFILRDNDLKNYPSKKKIGRIKHYIQPNDLAYIFYTSGSTGEPKGVMVEHNSIVNVLEKQIKMFEIRPKDRSLLFLSINFDGSLSDIGTALLSGATLCIETKNNLRVVTNLSKILRDRAITHLDIPPSLLEILSLEKMPSTLKTIIIGGDICKTEIVKRWAKKFRLINVYGPTEATIASSMILCDPDKWDGPDIGQPIKNTGYKIRNGELLISGIGLARGYLNKKDLTEKKFSALDGKRYYHTGDLVRISGQKIYFLGRKDRQIKINGQLIAPEEIERALQHNKVVRESVVITKKMGGKKKIIAFVEAINKQRDVTERQLKTYLQRSLPHWMVPSKIVFVKNIPRNINGKIDYRKLMGVTKYKTLGKKEIVSAKDSTQERLRKIWSRILNKDDICPDDNFFDLGGDSLAVIQMIIESEKIGINIPIGSVSKNMTIRSVLNRTNATRENGFKKDAIITKEWKNLFLESRHLTRAGSSGVLITGCTGLLGIHVLKKLLSTSTPKIYTIVRAKNKKGALDRIKQTAKPYRIKFSYQELSRLRVVTGDITKRNLGLSKKDLKDVLKNVEEIYHLAAEVNMVKPYEELCQTNVSGTKEIVRLAMTDCLKKINYASTLSVFVATDRNTGVAIENDDLKKTKTIYGGYARSKWVAERFLQEIPRGILPINIFRFGLITGNSTTGKFSPHDYLNMFMSGLTSLGVVPDGNHKQMTLDVTPIDYATEAMIQIAQKSDNGAYHVANNSGFNLKMIIDTLAERGIKIKTLPQKDWQNFIGKRSLSTNESATYAALCRLYPSAKKFERLRGMDLFQATNIRFDRANADKYLRGTGIVIPKPNKELLNKYLNQMNLKQK